MKKDESRKKEKEETLKIFIWHAHMPYKNAQLTSSLENKALLARFLFKERSYLVLSGVIPVQDATGKLE